MGWACGSYVFDPVVRALQARVPDADTRTALASVLIEALQHADWDTEDESVTEFRGDAAIMNAFAANGIPIDDEELD